MKITGLSCILGMFVVSVGLCSCSDDEDSGKKYTPKDYSVEGKVEKGPFVEGSTITMQPMNEKMQATGNTYSTLISDNSGAFRFNTETFEQPFAQLTANGYFYHEVRGTLSEGPLTLRALVDLSDKSSVNINILTHLKYQRVLNLVTSGKTFREANEQAQLELLTAFGLQRFAKRDVSQFSITAGTEEAGALIAVSSLLLYWRSEAELTEYLASVGRDFADDGKFSEDTKAQLKEDRTELRAELEYIVERIINRYEEELRQEITVKDLAYFFDWDDDGVAGNEISADPNAVQLSVTEIEVPAEGGSYDIEIRASIPVSLTGRGIDVVLPEKNSLYKASVIECTKTIDNDVLRIVVKPSTSKIDSSIDIPLYDVLGNQVASLKVTQKGTPTGNLLSETGIRAVSTILEPLADAWAINQALDALYTGQTSNGGFSIPLSANNPNLLNIWKDYYMSISQTLQIINLDKTTNIKLLQAPCNALISLAYLNMVTLWGDVPYKTEQNLNEWSWPREDENRLLDALSARLTEAIEQLGEKKNNFPSSDAEEAIFFSSDVPRMILAQVYMYQNKYAEAKDLLLRMISSGYYQLDSEVVYTAHSKEVIYGVSWNGGTRSAWDEENNFLPILIYTDVILSMAECEYRLGNEPSAQNYLNQVISKKNISVSSNLLTGIKEARCKGLSQYGGYFAFLKRMKLAKEELQLADYQLLLPIPDHELAQDPSLSQNPGYY